MPRRSIWSARQRAALFDLPTDEAALLRHYTLSDDDIEHIRVRRGGHNRLGFALQLCAFRYPGRILTVGEAIPLTVLGFIAAQLGMGAEDLDGYAIREETRREHLSELRRIYGYRMFSGGGGCARDLKAWLEHEAEGAPSNEGLARRFVEECRRRQVILPGLSVLERLCASALVAAERRIEARIVAGLDDAMRMGLDRLLTEEVDGGVSRFVWLRRFEVGQNSADINSLLDRLEFLQGFDLPPDLLETVPPHRVARLRRQGERYFTDGLRDIFFQLSRIEMPCFPSLRFPGNGPPKRRNAGARSAGTMVLRTTRRWTVTTPCQLRMIDPEKSEILTRQTPPGLTADDARRIAAAVGASRAENTVKSYTRAFRAFSAWCAQRGVPDLPASPEAIAAYLTERAAAGWRAAISDAHKRAGFEDSASHEGVKRVVAGLAREDTRPQCQAKPLTAEALAAVRATAKLPRKFSGRMEPDDTARRRGLVDIAVAATMRDCLLRVSEAARLRWGDVEVQQDGSGRIFVRRSKSDQEGAGSSLYLGETAVKDLLAIRPEAAVIDPEALVFGLSISQIERRIRAAALAAGLGDGFSGHSGRVGMAQDLSAAGAELPELMTAGRWRSPEMPAVYTRRQAAGRGAVARYYRQKG